MSSYTRKIVVIDKDKCNGCGLCVPDCEEGAIQIIDGKAVLVADNLCDGLGNCLGACPQDAISIEERVADSFDEEAVKKHLEEAKTTAPAPKLPCGCPGTMARKIQTSCCPSEESAATSETPSRLGQWPVLLPLVPVQGDIWNNADVLISADCVAYAMGNFHEKLLSGKTLAVGCPKLDDIQMYTEKLTTIFSGNNIKSVTIAHMEVPCCTGLVVAVKTALEKSGKTNLPFKDVTISVDGRVLREV